MILPSDASSSQSPDAEDDLLAVLQMIQQQSPEAQKRIQATAQILREILRRDSTDESLLALTLVMTEVASDQ